MENKWRFLSYRIQCAGTAVAVLFCFVWLLAFYMAVASGLKLRPILFCGFGQAGHVAGVDINTGDHGALCDKGKRTFVPNTRVCSGYDRNSIL